MKTQQKHYDCRTGLFFAVKPKTQQTEHDCDKCGEHFSTCICPGTHMKTQQTQTDKVMLVIAEYDELKAHAQRLADALAMACRVIEGENLDEAMAGEYEILTDALAEWEGSKQ